MWKFEKKNFWKVQFIDSIKKKLYIGSDDQWNA